MVNGIETRVPFLDHNLFEYSFNLKNNLKFRDNQSRWVFKKIFFNKKLNLQNKKSIVDPQTDWFKKELKEYFYSIIDSSEFNNSDYFDNKYVKSFFEKFLISEKDTSFNLIQLMSTQVFLNHFKKFS